MQQNGDAFQATHVSRATILVLMLKTALASQRHRVFCCSQNGFPRRGQLGTLKQGKELRAHMRHAGHLLDPPRAVPEHPFDISLACQIPLKTAILKPKREPGQMCCSYFRHSSNSEGKRL
jgi:hypothetical protein